MPMRVSTRIYLFRTSSRLLSVRHVQSIWKLCGKKLQDFLKNYTPSHYAMCCSTHSASVRCIIWMCDARIYLLNWLDVNDFTLVIRIKCELAKKEQSKFIETGISEYKQWLIMLLQWNRKKAAYDMVTWIEAETISRTTSISSTQKITKS